MIRVTFADGATEDREDDSPCIGSLLDPALKHPSEERWYLWLDGDRWPLSFCGHSASPLSQWRGWGAWIWRIASAPNEPLAGQWAECRVETCEEQIARLTTERDAAEERLADLRAWASGVVERGLAEAPKHPGNAEATWTIVSILETVVARIDGIDGESK